MAGRSDRGTDVAHGLPFLDLPPERRHVVVVGLAHDLAVVAGDDCRAAQRVAAARAAEAEKVIYMRAGSLPLDDELLALDHAIEDAQRAVGDTQHLRGIALGNRLDPDKRRR